MYSSFVRFLAYGSIQLFDYSFVPLSGCAFFFGSPDYSYLMFRVYSFVFVDYSFIRLLVYSFFSFKRFFVYPIIRSRLFLQALIRFFGLLVYPYILFRAYLILFIYSFMRLSDYSCTRLFF